MTEDLPIVKGIIMVRKCDIVKWLRSHKDNDLVDMDGMNEAADEIERLKEALSDLVDLQNGPPLITLTEKWNTTMTKARKALEDK